MYNIREYESELIWFFSMNEDTPMFKGVRGKIRRVIEQIQEIESDPDLLFDEVNQKYFLPKYYNILVDTLDNIYIAHKLCM